MRTCSFHPVLMKIITILMLLGLVSGCVYPTSGELTYEELDQSDTDSSEIDSTSDSDDIVSQAASVVLSGLLKPTTADVTLIWQEQGSQQVLSISVDENGYGEIEQLPASGSFALLVITENEYGVVDEGQSGSASFDGSIMPTSITVVAGTHQLNGQEVIDEAIPEGVSAAVSTWLRNLYRGLGSAGLCVAVEWYLETYHGYWCPNLSWYWDTVDVACGCCITFSTCAAATY